MAIECKNLTNGLRISTNGSYFACCHTFNAPFKDKNGNLLNASTHTVPQALGSHSRNEMISDFNKGKRHPACKVCWDAEDAGFESKRERDNKTYHSFPHRIKDKIFFLELNLGNTCNLACRICHISASSKWRKDHGVLNPHLTEDDLDAYSLEFSRSFEDDSTVWDELHQLVPELQQLDIYGGEPMLMKKQWELLEYSVKSGYAQKQHMSFNTNGTIITEKYIDILTSFKSCRIGFSIDGVGERFHYLRYPGKWEVVDKNIKTWLDKTKHLPSDKMIFELACTISVLNVLNVFEIADYAIENNLKVHIGFVYNPVYLSITNLPLDIKQKVLILLEEEYTTRQTKLNELTDITKEEYIRVSEIYRQVSKVITTLKLPNSSDAEQWSTFKSTTRKLDKSRKEDFRTAFPDTEKLYGVYADLI